MSNGPRCSTIIHDKSEIMFRFQFKICNFSMMFSVHIFNPPGFDVNKS